MAIHASSPPCGHARSARGQTQGVERDGTKRPSTEVKHPMIDCQRPHWLSYSKQRSRAHIVYVAPLVAGAAMWDRYDPRSPAEREHGDFGDRSRGSRGGTGE